MRQQPAKVAKIGELLFGGHWLVAVTVSGVSCFRPELRQLGCHEGKNVHFKVRFADGKPDRLRALADELVRLKVDVILATSGGEIRAAKNATRTIHVVFMTTGDPVAAGIVRSPGAAWGEPRRVPRHRGGVPQ